MRHETRHFKDCKRSEPALKMDGWTIGDCISFAEALEANEDRYAEQAAIDITCLEHGISFDECLMVVTSLPEGEWWKTPK